jgi:hypothetical protein
MIAYYIFFNEFEDTISIQNNILSFKCNSIYSYSSVVFQLEISSTCLFIT